jgi:maleylpyruvate isomerase
MRLYGYWRSSATHRVRIALNWKGLSFDAVPTNLAQGEHRRLTYLDKNPQGLAPTLEADGAVLGQSLAILEYLEETRPEPPLLPKDPLARARVRSLAQLVACEIHPLTNLRVLNHVRRAYALDDGGVNAWYRHWIAQGLAPLEAELARTSGVYSHGDEVSLADVCLVPQLVNARRHRCDLDPYPTVLRVEEACLALPAFDKARPERQPDARERAGIGR